MLILKPITTNKNQNKLVKINSTKADLSQANSAIENKIVENKAIENKAIENQVANPIMADPITVAIKPTIKQTVNTSIEKKPVEVRRPIVKQSIKEPTKPNIDTIANLLMLELDRIGEPYILDAIGPSAYTILTEGYGLSSLDEVASSIQFYIAEVKKEYPRWFSMCECDAN